MPTAGPSSRRHVVPARRGAGGAHVGGPALEPLEGRSVLDATLPLVTLAIADGAVSERDQDQGAFVITRFGNTDAPLRVNFQISGGATPGVDYLGLSNAATIPAGRRSVRIPVVPIDDLDVEGPESVRIVLSPDAAYRLDDANPLNRNLKVVIQDDDVLPTVTLATPDADAAEIGQETATFTVRRTGPADLPLTVSFRIGGSATPGADYQEIPTTVTIQPGRRAAFVTVRPLGDGLFEGDETVRLTVLPAGAGQYQLLTGRPESFRRTVVIRDRPLVGLAVLDPVATTTPGDDAAFLVYRTGRTDAELRVSYQMEGTAVMGTDYAILPQFITIPAGQSSVRVVIAGIGASLPGPSRTARLTLLAQAGYNLNPFDAGAVSAYVRMIEDSTPPQG